MKGHPGIVKLYGACLNPKKRKENTFYLFS